MSCCLICWLAAKRKAKCGIVTSSMRKHKNLIAHANTSTANRNVVQWCLVKSDKYRNSPQPNTQRGVRGVHQKIETKAEKKKITSNETSKLQKPLVIRSQTLGKRVRKKYVLWLPDSSEHHQRQNSVIEFIADSCYPVTMVDRPPFRKMMNTLDPKFKIPSKFSLQKLSIQQIEPLSGRPCRSFCLFWIWWVTNLDQQEINLKQAESDRRKFTECTTAPVSQAYVESIFSLCGLLTSGRRNRAINSLELRAFLKLNKHLCDLQ